MARQSIFREFFAFLKHEKKWWLVPLVVVLLAFGGLMILAQAAGPLAPFIYPLF